MGKRTSNQRTRHSRLVNRPATTAILGSIVLLLIAPAAFSQVQMQVDVSPSRIVEGDVFQITMTVPQTNPGQVRREPIRVPEGLQVVEAFVERGENEASTESGDSDASDAEDDGSGDARYAVRLRARRSGFFEIPSLRVSAAGQELSSGAILIQVHPAGGGDVPLEGYWDISTEAPMAGDTLLLSLYIRADEPAVFPDEVRFSRPDWGSFREVSGVGEISESEYSTGVLYNIPVLTFVVTPAAVDEYTVPAAELGVDGETIRVPSVTIETREPPQEIRDSGAIGDFTYTAEIEPNEVFLGEPITVTLQLEGQGNLPYIQLPTPRVENLLVTGEDEHERIQPTENGYSGVRSKTYRLSTRDVGRFQILLPEFRWYSPAEDAVLHSPARTASVRVLPVPLGDNDDQVSGLGLLSSRQIRRIDYPNGSDSPVVLLWLLPAALSLLLRRWVSTRSGRAVLIAGLALLASVAVEDSGPAIGNSNGEAVAVSENPAEVYADYSDILKRHPNMSGLWYNAGIAAFRSDEPIASVHHFRKAVQIRPELTRYREALAWVEKGLGLESQIAPPSRFSFNLRLSGLVVVVAGMALLWNFYRVRRMGGIAVVFIAAGILAGVLAVGLAGAHTEGARNAGILEGETERTGVYRIPVQDVQPWMEITTGTTVYLLDVSGDFYLIETGPGVQGWVERDSVRTL